MNTLFNIALVFTISVMVWLVMFDAISDSQTVYQECGGKWCAMSEVDK